MKFIKSYTFPFDTDLIKKDSLGKSGVYLILNLINKNCYIGSAISKTSSHNRLYFRFRNYFLSSFKSSDVGLRESMEKYGKNNFSFNILAYDVPDNIINLENYFINKIYLGGTKNEERKCGSTPPTPPKPKPTIVLDLSGNLIKEYQSAKEIIKDYTIDYRTVRRHLKNNIPIKKLGILVKYKI